MDSKVNAATWAMARGVSVVICNGMQEKAIKTIISGRKVGTFFTDCPTVSTTSVDVMAENGKQFFLGKYSMYPELGYLKELTKQP